MSEEINNNFTLTSPVRLIWGDLLKAKQLKLKNGKLSDPKFAATVTMEPGNPDVAALSKLIKEVALAKWPGADLSNLKIPLVRGEKRVEKEAKKAAKDGRKPKNYPFFDGKVVLEARTKKPPKLFVLTKQGKVVKVDDENLSLYSKTFYGGCNVVLSISLVAYEPDNDDMPRGVTAYLNKVLFHSDGERIGGGDDADAFSGYAGKVVDDPTDDEIPF